MGNFHAYFNPRTPCGVRHYAIKGMYNMVGISIHAPLAGCDNVRAELLVNTLHNFNPRTPCGVRQVVAASTPEYADISIHAPLAGCDANGDYFSLVTDISIHAPLAGCDFQPSSVILTQVYFNPRTPCGVRRMASLPSKVTSLFQSTHPLRGATRDAGLIPPITVISIHAPLAGCDGRHVSNRWRRNISIHAPLAGCDLSFLPIK